MLSNPNPNDLLLRLWIFLSSVACIFHECHLGSFITKAFPSSWKSMSSENPVKALNEKWMKIYARKLLFIWIWLKLHNTPSLILRRKENKWFSWIINIMRQRKFASYSWDFSSKLSMEKCLRMFSAWQMFWNSISWHYKKLMFSKIPLNDLLSDFSVL